MPTPRSRSLAVILIETPEAVAVVLASQVETFHANATGATIDLDQHLGIELTHDAGSDSDSGSSRSLEIKGPRGPIRFRTRAAVRLTELRESDLYRLPSVLRDAGCESWVRGLAFALKGEDRIGMWIDLRELGKRAREDPRQR